VAGAVLDVQAQDFPYCLMRLNIGRSVAVAWSVLCEICGQTPPKSRPPGAISWRPLIMTQLQIHTAPREPTSKCWGFR
jgi:hypothetical protein